MLLKGSRFREDRRLAPDIMSIIVRLFCFFRKLRLGLPHVWGSERVGDNLRRYSLWDGAGGLDFAAGESGRWWR